MGTLLKKYIPYCDVNPLDLMASSDKNAKVMQTTIDEIGDYGAKLASEKGDGTYPLKPNIVRKDGQNESQAVFHYRYKDWEKDNCPDN